jgi:hypothetical protein
MELYNFARRGILVVLGCVSNDSILLVVHGNPL